MDKNEEKFTKIETEIGLKLLSRAVKYSTDSNLHTHVYTLLAEVVMRTDDSPFAFVVYLLLQMKV